MQFLIRAYDGEGKLDKRMEVRPRNLEGMKKLSEHIISAGGLLDDNGKMKGSGTMRILRLSLKWLRRMENYNGQMPQTQL